GGSVPVPSRSDCAGARIPRRPPHGWACEWPAASSPTIYFRANRRASVRCVRVSRQSQAAASDHVYALIASFLGWTLDAFDFFVLLFVLPAVATEFGRSIPDIALAITVTLAFRPLGAFIFGLMADRYGRRLPLMLDLVFFS